MTVKDVMTPAIVTCKPGDDLAGASAQMQRHDCGFLPVVDGRGLVVGVLTDRDVCLAVASHTDACHTSVEDAMSAPVFGCLADDELDRVLKTMSKHHVRRLPVLSSQNGHLVGVLSLDDIVSVAYFDGAPACDDIVVALMAITSPASSGHKGRHARRSMWWTNPNVHTTQAPSAM